MRVDAFFEWAGERDLSNGELADVVREMNRQDLSIEDVTAEDLDELAQDAGVLIRAAKRIWSFISGLF